MKFKNHRSSTPVNLDLSNLPVDQNQTSALISLPELEPGRFGFHILFLIQKYPLSQHLCFMRHQNGIPLDDLSELRFSEMKFDREPPGVKVGHWPNWRCIPDMPKIAIEIGIHSFEGRYNFWGDEFETNVVRVFVLVSIPDSKSSEIKLIWNDARLSPLKLDIYPSQKIRPEPKPVQLCPELQDKHPRLLFSSSDLASLRQKKNQSCQGIWHEIEALLKNWDLPFEITPESKLLPGAERLHEFDRAILGSFHALMTEDAASIQRARAAFASLLDLALYSNYEPMAIDTQAGECLFTLSLTYDWLVSFLSDEEQNQFQHKLFQVADRVWQHLGNEREDFGQAHFLGCSHGLLAFSFLFWEQHPRASEWTAYLRGVFEHVLTMLPDDGFYPHGINLWIYEHAFLLRYLELFRRCAGLNYWDHSSYWKNASLFRQASLSPDKKNGITFGDPQYRVAGDAWMHYLIASRISSAAAQNLGSRLSNVSVADVDFRNAPARRRVWELLYFHPFKGSKPLKGCDEMLHFQDGGQIFWRQKSHSKETLITFRSGDPLGKQRYYWGEWSGYGHADPCNGSFLIAQNESFLFCGPGPVYRRDTSLHNTLTFDNHGQIGDSMVWAPEFIADDRFPKFEFKTNEKFDSVITDLTRCYPDFIGVKKAVRRFMVFHQGVVLVHDSIQLNSERAIQWNIHTYGSIVEEAMNEKLKFQFSDDSEQAELIVLLPAQLQWRTGLSTFVPAYPNAGKRDRYLQMFKSAAKCEFLILVKLGDGSVKYDLDFADKSDRLWRLKLTIGAEEFFIDHHP